MENIAVLCGTKGLLLFVYLHWDLFSSCIRSYIILISFDGAIHQYSGPVFAISSTRNHCYYSCSLPSLLSINLLSLNA